jgi:hypothetical protein
MLLEILSGRPGDLDARREHPEAKSDEICAKCHGIDESGKSLRLGVSASRSFDVKEVFAHRFGGSHLGDTVAGLNEQILQDSP